MVFASGGGMGGCRMARSALSAAEVDEVWRRWRSGEAVRVLARQMRVSPSTLRDLLKRTGGIRPVPRRRWELRLWLDEREEISGGLAAGDSLPTIAAGLGQAPSTVSREVAHNGGRRGYRAVAAESAAWTRAARPKQTKRPAGPGCAPWSKTSWSCVGPRSRSPAGCGGGSRPAHAAVPQQTHVLDAVRAGHHARDQRGNLRPGVCALVRRHRQLLIDQPAQPDPISQPQHRHQATGRHEILLVEPCGTHRTDMR
jgi:hypothetical protein